MAERSLQAAQIMEALTELRGGGAVRFARLLTLCTRYFGEPRIRGSHHIFKMPWPGDPRINLQAVKGHEAKPYQVAQVTQALAKLLLVEAQGSAAVKRAGGKP